MNYSEKLKDPRWQKKRLEILNRDEFTCRTCKDKETQLQVHHLKYKGEPWEVSSEHLITLCKHCHSLLELFNKSSVIDVYSLRVIKIHSTKKGQLIATGVHGNRVLMASINQDSIVPLFNLSKSHIDELHNFVTNG